MSNLLEDDEEQVSVVEAKPIKKARKPEPEPSESEEIPWTRKEIDEQRLAAASRIAAVMIDNISIQDESIVLRSIKVATMLTRVILLRQKFQVAVLANNEQIDLTSQKQRGGVSVE